jgi:lipopolysaccharide export system permease protein
MKFSSMSFAELFAYIQGEEARGEKLPAKVYNKLWDKLTFPIACFVIVLCAVPLAITPPRQGSDTGFILSLGVLFLFYLMRTASAALGSTGLFTLGGLIPENWGYLVGAWLPLVILGGLGVGLLVRKSRRL